jgi:hypothetical protein
MSERKIVDHKFLHGNTFEIDEMIMKLINDGYVPFYGHTVCRGIIGQALVKYEDIAK